MDLLTGDIRPVRRAPPPPSSRKAGPHPRNDDLLIIDQEEEEGTHSTGRYKGPSQKPAQNGLPRSASLPFTSDTRKKPPPPRPPPPKRSQHQHNSSSAIKERSGSIIGKLRGPPSSRTKQTLTHCTTSAPCTPISEASLIDLSSPPGSPTTRSGSDGLSVNSFGSESSTGNPSSGFDDSFDPFGSIQDSVYSVPKRIGVSSFYSNVSAPAFSVPRNASFYEESQDPFNALANRASKYEIKSQQVQNNSVSLNASQLSSKALNPMVKSNTQNNIAKPESKPIYKPTIIRPKAPVSSVEVMNAGDSGISSEMSELGSIDWSAAMKGNTAKQSTKDTSSSHIIEQTIPEEPPPLPPRPESEQEDHDRPHGIADFDFAGTQPDDLPLKNGDVVQLLYRINDEWLFGRSGPKEGMFPQCFIKIVVPLAGEQIQSSHSTSSGSIKYKSSHQPNVNEANTTASHTATVLYTFLAETAEDLPLHEGSLVQVTGHLNDEWLYGQCNGKWGQFPANHVDRIPPGLPQI